MKKEKKDRLINLSVSLLTVVFILLFWSVAAAVIGSKFILPSIPQTFNAFGELFTDADFYLSLLNTLLRTLIAFAVSFFIAFLFAFLVNKFRRAKYAVEPIVAICRALPTVAVVLLLLFWTNSKVAPVIVSMLVVLPTAYTNCNAAFDAVDKDAVEMCRLFNVPQTSVFKKVILPQMTPQLLYSVGAGFSLNLKLMVAAEVLAATGRSLGNKLNYYNFNLMISEMLAVVVITVIIGLTVELIFNALSKKAGKKQ